MIEIAFVAFVTLHRPDGEPVEINPRVIAALTPSHTDHHPFTKEAHCLVHLPDRKIVAVRETCDEVHRATRRPHA